MDENTLKKLAVALKSNDPKIKQEAIKAVNNIKKIAQGTGEEAEKAKTILKTLQSYMTQKAAHGAKLQYIKSLKHICPEGEELVYYKKGGSVTCGCKKKEQGGEVQEAKCGAAAKFKKIKKGKFGITAFAEAVTGSHGGFTRAEKEQKEQKEQKKQSPKTIYFQGKPQMIVGRDIQRGSGNDTSEQEKKDKSAKDYYRGKTNEAEAVKKAPKAKTDHMKKGSKIKAVDKFKAAKCGSKLKKHLQGGSLNRIPFYQGRTSKGEKLN